MSHNKILSAAIVAALSVGSGAAQAAGTFALTQPAVTTTPNVAYELFPTNPSALPSGTTFQATYTLGLEKVVAKAFYINYTLTGGKWESDPSSSSIELQDNTGAARTAPTISFADVSDTIAQFLVLADGTNFVNKDDKLVLKDFQVKETGLATAGENVQLGITLEDTSGGEVDAANTLTLVQSGVGTSVSFGTGDDSDVEIDVGQGGAKFTGGKYGTNAASLGTINIQYPGTRMKDYDLTTDWDFKGTNGVSSGTLNISNGPFAASTQANQVFIEIDGDNCAFTAGDLPGAVSGGTTASWTLTQAQLVGLLGQGAKKICVTVASTNTGAINQTDEPPKATLVLKYVHNTTGISSEDKQRHIKKNGTICSVYNVTDATKLDNSNIRVINRSTRDGTLTASLRDQDNNEVFKNVNLGTIKPNQTMTWNSQELAEIAKGQGHSGEWGRGILTIGSDLINMELFALARNTNPAGSKALLNMSGGSTLSGCD